MTEQKAVQTVQAQLMHLIKGCQHVRDKRKGKHPEAVDEATFVAQEVLDQLVQIAIPHGHWERIAWAQANGGFVAPMDDEDRAAVMAYAAKERISVDSACLRIMQAGYQQLVGGQP